MQIPDTPFDLERPDLVAIPQHPLPPPYRLRAYRPGDGELWLALQQATEPVIPITADFFTRQFGDHLDALPDRMFFVEAADGVIAGTITAWWEHDRYKADGRGRIHWVAVHPAHQRRGLTKPMMTHALNRLSQEYRQAMLGTSSSRIWAIKVYLDFGFRPVPAELADPTIRAAWQAVQMVLQHPALSIENGEL